MLRRGALTVFVLVVSVSPADAHQPSAPSADDFPATVATTWFEFLYDVVKAEKTPPPQASRIYGITAVALYEAIAGGTLEHRSLAGQLNGLTSVPAADKEKTYHWPTVATVVLANTIRSLYHVSAPNMLGRINTLDRKFASEYQARVKAEDYERSVAHGRAVTGAILMWAATDGLSVHHDCPHASLATAGAWRPTPPQFDARPLQPCWGQLRPMVLTSTDVCGAPGPLQFSDNTTSRFHAAAVEVYKVGVGLSEEQKTIARYWADNPGETGTPAGHWIDIVSQIARKDRLSLAKAAEAYARVGIAVHDAFIGCWKTKYVYNLRRPVTYINDNFHGRWRSYVATPNFPSYPSGHSVQSGAVARVLTDMFGTRSFRDTTHVDHGLVPFLAPRAFRSFEDAAAEAAVSRLYGGIHYVFDNDHGLTSGKCIGEAILGRVKFRFGHP